VADELIQNENQGLKTIHRAIQREAAMIMAMANSLIKSSAINVITSKTIATITKK